MGFRSAEEAAVTLFRLARLYRYAGYLIPFGGFTPATSILSTDRRVNAIDLQLNKTSGAYLLQVILLV